MTVWDLVGAVLRRWYVVLFGLACTMAAGAHAITHDGVYWSQVDVVFLAPQSARFPNNLTTESGSLISVAGIVERRVNHFYSAPATSSPTATLVGQGVLDGYSVRLPDTGGQWAHNFSRQVLDVQVVGATEAGVRDKQDALLERIAAELRDLQAEAGVADRNRITTQAAAPVPSIHYLAGDRKRALAMTLLIGAALTLSAVAVLDERLRQPVTGHEERSDR